MLILGLGWESVLEGPEPEPEPEPPVVRGGVVALDEDGITEEDGTEEDETGTEEEETATEDDETGVDGGTTNEEVGETLPTELEEVWFKLLGWRKCLLCLAWMLASPSAAKAARRATENELVNCILKNGRNNQFNGKGNWTFSSRIEALGRWTRE